MNRNKLYRTVTILFTVLIFSGLLNYIYSQQAASYRLEVVESFPHDRSAYTQGLFFHNNVLYESCGQYGLSSFRQLELKSGKILRRLNFESKYFLEGACVLNGFLYILTWQENKCFVYDANSLEYRGELWNPREGWGITTDGKNLIMSDGTSKLYTLDPMTFAVKSEVEVKLNGKPLRFLNELEYINGDIWANVYGDDSIVIINPQNGIVKGVVDCRNLLPRSLYTSTTDVLNGIAYNPTDGNIYLTGKNWPKLYQVKIVKR